jgi:hypothetical protein
VCEAYSRILMIQIRLVLKLSQLDKTEVNGVCLFHGMPLRFRQQGQRKRERLSENTGVCLHYEISDMLRQVSSFRLTKADGCEDSANKVEASHVHISQVLI